MSFLKTDNISHFIELYILLQIFLFSKAGFKLATCLQISLLFKKKKKTRSIRSDLENLFKPHGALLAMFFVLHFSVCAYTGKNTSQT